MATILAIKNFENRAGERLGATTRIELLENFDKRRFLQDAARTKLNDDASKNGFRQSPSTNLLERAIKRFDLALRKSCFLQEFRHFRLIKICHRADDTMQSQQSAYLCSLTFCAHRVAYEACRLILILTSLSVE